MTDINTINYSNGTVAFIRTTEEPVFVLSIDKKEDSPTQVTVRRPTKSDRGVTHLVEYFFADELCTFEQLMSQQCKRQLTEFKENKKLRDTIEALPGNAMSPTPKGPMLN